MMNFTIRLISILISGCTSFAYTNKRITPDEIYSSRTSFEIKEDRGNKNVLMLLALSGGLLTIIKALTFHQKDFWEKLPDPSDI